MGDISELRDEVVKAIKDGRLTLKEVEDKLKSDEIPLDVLGTFHLLFCNKSHIPGGCTFYEEESRLSKGNCPAHMRWTRLAKLYLDTLDSSIEGLRYELSGLKEILRVAGATRNKGIVALYFILFYINECGIDVIEFTTRFVQLLNEVDPIVCRCYKEPGTVIAVGSIENPICKKCGLPIY